MLVKELQSLGLAVEAIGETGEVIRFGKEDEKKTQARMPTGSGLLGGMSERDLADGDF